MSSSRLWAVEAEGAIFLILMQADGEGKGPYLKH